MIVSRGTHSYGNPITKGELSKITIGNYCSISDLATFDCGMNHGTKYISTFPFNQKLMSKDIGEQTVMEILNHDKHPLTYGDITIGHDVLVSEQSFIRSGVSIGTGAIIGYGAVVLKDVLPYEVVGGVPAKHRRWRFYSAQIKYLLAIAWWNWPEEKIIENIHLLMSPDIGEFINLHRIK